MRRALIWLAALLPAPVWAAPVTVDDLIAEARADCASFDKGELTVGPALQTPVELTGDATLETVVDWSQFACSTLAAPYGGTGGNLISVLIAGQRFDFMELGWTVARLDGPVLLLSLHGAECGATGSDRCAEALVWSADRLMSVRDRTPEGEAAAEGDGG